MGTSDGTFDTCELEDIRGFYLVVYCFFRKLGLKKTAYPRVEPFFLNLRSRRDIKGVSSPRFYVLEDYINELWRLVLNRFLLCKLSLAFNLPDPSGKPSASQLELFERLYDHD